MSPIVEEQVTEAVESCLVNTGLAWIPALCAVLIIAMSLSAIAVVWLSGEIDVKRKVLRTITTFLWGLLFSGIDIVLALFAASGSVTAPSTLLVVSSIVIAAGGILAAASRTRNLIDWSDLKTCRYGVEESVSSTSSFWGSTLPREVELSENDMPRMDAACGKGQYSRSLGERRLADGGGAARLVFRSFSSVMSWLVPLLSIAGVTVLCFLFLEMPSNPSWDSIAESYMACELTVIAGIVAGLWLLFQRRGAGFVAAMALFLGLGLAEHFVEAFKGAAIMPSDLRSAGTGMAVAGGYEYEIGSVIVVLVSVFSLAAGALSWVKDPLSRFLSRKRYVVTERYRGQFLPKLVEHKQKKEDIRCLAKNVVACVLSVLLGFYVIQAPIAENMAIDWEDEGVEVDYWQTWLSADEYGLVPFFMNAVQLEDLEAPEGYSEQGAEELQSAMAGLYDQYIGASPERQAAAAQFESSRPNVVMIMNETFADLSYLGGLGVGYEGPAFVNHMDAIAKGSTNVSVYGGGTCNSEFEGLMGTSLGLVGGGISPYAIYDLSGIESLPKQFKSLGYDTTAIHPEYATNWGRDGVYPAIGFDTFIDRDAFVGEEESRGHYTDAATYRKVMEVLEEGDAPQFVFDLTMMNHGGYETGLIPEEDNVGYDFTGVIDDNAAAAANEYLSSLRMSDEDVQHFLEELGDFDEPTVVMFYGDHHPGFSTWFQEPFADRTSDVAYQESMYATEYFVWSNYAIDGSAWNPSGYFGQGVSGEDGDSEQLGDVLGPVLRGGMVAGGVEEENRNARAALRASGGAGREYPDIQGDFATYRGSMSPASLAAWALSCMGAPLTDYQKANYISRWWIQSNNVYGYMDAAGTWHPMEQADAIAGSDVYGEAMALFSEVATRGFLPSVEEVGEQRAALDATLVGGAEAEASRGIGAAYEEELVEEWTQEGTGFESGWGEQAEEAQDATFAPEEEDDGNLAFAEEDPMMQTDAMAVGGVEMQTVDAPTVLAAGESADSIESNAMDEVRSQMTSRDYQDALVVNVMRWLAYLNFSSLI